MLVRRIEPSVWIDFGEFEGLGVPAEVVQHKDFRAGKNALSFWRFDSETATWREDALLAIVGGFKRVDGVFAVVVDEQEMVAQGLPLRETPGDTCFPSLRGFHVDAVALDARRLASVAEIVARAARQDKRLVQFTHADVVRVLVRAVRERRLMNVDNLPSPSRWPWRKRPAADGRAGAPPRAPGSPPSAEPHPPRYVQSGEPVPRIAFFTQVPDSSPAALQNSSGRQSASL